MILNNLNNSVDFRVETGQTNGWYWTKFKSGKIVQVRTVNPTSQFSSWELGVPMSDPVLIVHGVDKAIQNLKVVGVQSYNNQVHLECVGAQLGSSYVKIVASNTYF